MPLLIILKFCHISHKILNINSELLHSSIWQVEDSNLLGQSQINVTTLRECVFCFQMSTIFLILHIITFRINLQR